MVAKTVASRKARGRNLQNKTAEMLKEYYPQVIFKPAIMGETGRDVHAYGNFPFSIECKNQEALNIWSAIQQAEANAGVLVPLLVFKRNRSKIYCTLEFEKLLELLTGRR